MLSYLFLLLAIIVIMLLAYRLLDGEVLSPTLVACAAYLVSTILAMIGLLSWNDQEYLYASTMAICILGIVSFFIGELISRIIFKCDNKKDNSRKNHTIHIRAIVYILITIFIIAATIILIVEIKRVCLSFGFKGDSLPEALAFYRSKTSLFSNELNSTGIDIGFIPKQMKKVVDCLFVIFAFIATNNFLSNKKNKNSYIYPLVICMMCVPSSFLGNGGRAMLMHMIISFAMIVAILFQVLYKKTKTPVVNKKKLIIAICCAALLSGLIFYSTTPIVGRNNNDSNIVEYMSFYLGTPIASMNKKITEGGIEHDKIGEKTFYGVYSTLDRYGIIKYDKPNSNDWVTHNGYHSNVYTSFWSEYCDFGILGVIILQAIFGFCSGLMYVMVTKKDNIYLLLVYAFYAYVLIDQIRDNHFYSLLSSTTIVYLVIIYCLYFLLIKKDYKWIKLNKK